MMVAHHVKVRLEVDVPDVTTKPSRVEVRCGETTAYVYEHGHQGSGDWAAWMSGGGHIIGEGGRVGYTFDQAVDDATEYVRAHERARLLRERLAREIKQLDHGGERP